MESLSGPGRAAMAEDLGDVAPSDLDVVLDRLTVEFAAVDSEDPFAGLEERRGVLAAAEDLIGEVARHCDGGRSR